jgi:hypothetical protein
VGRRYRVTYRTVRDRRWARGIRGFRLATGSALGFLFSKRVVVDALRAAGETAHAHDDHFERDTPDVEWLAEIGRRGWVAITKDKNIRRNELERRALIDANVACFMVGRGDLSAVRTFKRSVRRYLRLVARGTRIILMHRHPEIAGDRFPIAVAILHRPRGGIATTRRRLDVRELRHRDSARRSPWAREGPCLARRAWSLGRAARGRRRHSRGRRAVRFSRWLQPDVSLVP